VYNAGAVMITASSFLGGTVRFSKAPGPFRKSDAGLHNGMHATRTIMPHNRGPPPMSLPPGPPGLVGRGGSAPGPWPGHRPGPNGQVERTPSLPSHRKHQRPWPCP
jgi:hypothetical protein